MHFQFDILRELQDAVIALRENVAVFTKFSEES